MKFSKSHFTTPKVHNDPNEQKNLAKTPEHAAKLKELRAALEAYLKTMPGTFGDLTEK